MLYEVFRRPKIEPRINYSRGQSIEPSRPSIGRLTLVDDTLEPDHGEEAAGHCGGSNQGQDNYSQQAPSLDARGLLEKLVALCGGHG